MMNDLGQRSTPEDRLYELVLCRLLAAPSKGLGRATLQKSLTPLVDRRWTAAEWSQELDRALARGQDAGQVERLGRAAFALTDLGRTEIQRRLGAASLPERADWRHVKNTLLTARALDVTLASPKAKKRIASADGLRAAILKSAFSLDVDKDPTLTQARDALAWRQLGIESTRPFTKSAVLEELLGRLFEGGARPDAKRAPTQLAASLVGARRTHPDELRRAVIGSWLGEGAAATPAALPTATPAPPPPPASLPPTLDALAARILDVARASRTGRFGENKVFIGHVWAALEPELRARGIDRARFDEMLVEANRRDLVQLSRADLVEAMDPGDVRSSEVSYRNTTFHFIRVA